MYENWKQTSHQNHMNICFKGQPTASMSLNCKNSIFSMYWLCWVESGSLKIKDYGHWTHDNKLVTCWLFVCQKQDPINQKYDWEKRKSLLFVASTFRFQKSIPHAKCFYKKCSREKPSSQFTFFFRAITLEIYETDFHNNNLPK